jgi:hypothetical protein
MLGGVDDAFCVRQELIPFLQDLHVEHDVPEMPHNLLIYTLDDAVLFMRVGGGLDVLYAP